MSITDYFLVDIQINSNQINLLQGLPHIHTTTDVK